MNKYIPILDEDYDPLCYQVWPKFFLEEEIELLNPSGNTSFSFSDASTGSVTQIDLDITSFASLNLYADDFGDTPPEVTGLQLWLDASDGETLFQDTAQTTPASADTNPIGSWADKSGNGNDVEQSTAGERPTLQTDEQNGLSVIEFDGVDNHLDNSTGTLDTIINADDYTIMIVFKATSIDTNEVTLTNNDSLISDSNNNWGVFLKSTPEACAYGDTDTCVNIQTNQWGYFTAIQDSGNLDAYINLRTSDNNSTSNISNVTGSYHIGQNGGGTEFFTGQIAEVLVYSAALTTYERKAVESYLANKWNIDPNYWGVDGPSLGIEIPLVEESFVDISSYECIEYEVTYQSGPASSAITISIHVNTGRLHQNTYYRSDEVTIDIGDTATVKLDLNNATAVGVNSSGVVANQGLVSNFGFQFEDGGGSTSIVGQDITIRIGGGTPDFGSYDSGFSTGFDV